ncbi:hypothetical protein [Gordonia sp. SL306]|uniref:hypothetical protein n=1 Tax=Gordonia sp. SL306 TaxID=2995145 RepID=UPI00226E7386|nr:hypothetical protein [Gordonia sp. SL306]WAC54280.1 hypothetical protein OVA31_16530 [Gordonia sp. SL306]
MAIDTASSAATLVLPASGAGRVVGRTAAGTEVTVEIAGWSVLDSFVERFAPGIAADLEDRFADLVAEWESTPATVVYAVVNGHDVLVGLSYQTAPAEILRAVWSGLCVAIARDLRDNEIDGPVVIHSDHPGTDVLADRLAILGVPVVGSRGRPADPTEVDRRVQLDSLVRDVATTAQEALR